MYFSSTMGTGVSRSIRCRPSDDTSPIACEDIKVEFIKEFTSIEKAAEKQAQREAKEKEQQEKAAEKQAQREAKEKEQQEKTKGKQPWSDYSPQP